ncbi:MAG: hypothetical protein R6V17_00425 [Halanaerobacter sp.]
MNQDKKLDLLLEKVENIDSSLENLEEGQQKLNNKVDRLQDETELISRNLSNHTHDISQAK